MSHGRIRIRLNEICKENGVFYLYKVYNDTGFLQNLYFRIREWVVKSLCNFVNPTKPTTFVCVLLNITPGRKAV